MALLQVLFFIPAVPDGSSGDGPEATQVVPYQDVQIEASYNGVKQLVYLASTVDIGGLYYNGPDDNGQGATLTNNAGLTALVLDGVTVETTPEPFNRILLKNQANPITNGVYDVINVGSGSVAWVLQRSTDFDNSSDGQIGPGALGLIYAGTTQAERFFVLVTPPPITIGTTPILFELSAVGSGGAPDNATYLLQTANGSLTNAQAMGALTTGIVKNTTTTGVQSIANGTSGPATADYYAPSYQYFYSNVSPLNMFLSTGGATTPSSPAANNVLIGTIPTALTGGSNICLGFNSFSGLMSGNFNVCIGDAAGGNLSGSASSNCFIGYQAGLVTDSASNNNVAIGYQAGSGFAGLSDCVFLGWGAKATTGSLVNAGAIGYQATISVSNALNMGTGIAIGFNNPSPAYSIDIEPLTGGGVGAIAFPVSTLPATSASKGTVWRDSSDDLNYTNSSGVTTILNNATRGISPKLDNIFLPSGDINLDNTSGQTLLIGNGSTGTNLYMPDPTSTNAFALGYPYIVMMAKTAPGYIFEQMNIRNFGGVQINDLNGSPITMTPCDTWVVCLMEQLELVIY